MLSEMILTWAVGKGILGRISVLAQRLWELWHDPPQVTEPALK